IRAGDRFVGNATVEAAKSVRFTDPPPPYDAFVGRLDGRAIWLARDRLRPRIDQAAFGPDAPLADSPDLWDSRQLNYHAEFGTAERPLEVLDHHGGPMDWYSADAMTERPLAGPAAASLRPTLPR